MNRINDHTCDDQDCFIPFDVVRLFTSIPVSLAIDIISQLLRNDTFLHDRTKLTANDVIEALNLCAKSTVFSFKNILYRQIFGVPKGSCISPVIANIFMEHIERKAISICHTPPTLCTRYVDDTFCIIEKDKGNEFYQHLNSTSTIFTLERKHNNSLAFLEVKVARHNNSLSTTVFKKPTHTDCYLHFTSHHPKHQKLAISKTLHNRIETHVTNPSHKHRLHKQVQNTVLLNGFSRSCSRNCAKKSVSPRNAPFTSFTRSPFIREASDKIKRILNETGVKVAMKPHLTIGEFLPSPKDRLNERKISSIVYKVPCHDCKFTYISQNEMEFEVTIRGTQEDY